MIQAGQGLGDSTYSDPGWAGFGGTLTIVIQAGQGLGDSTYSDPGWAGFGGLYL